VAPRDRASGTPSISFGQKRVKAGGVLTITFEGNQYTLEIVSIDRRASSDTCPSIWAKAGFSAIARCKASVAGMPLATK
jgi:hypothetical protein